jgi:N utilization substance protein A
MAVEILQVADQVAREKGIDREVVIEAMETAIQTASRKKYGQHKNIVAKFNRRSGEFQLNQLREVVDNGAVEDPDLQIELDRAHALNPDAILGNYIAEALPQIEFGRIAAQTAKQVIFQKVREAERDRIFREYADRKGQLVNGLVKRVERSHIYVDLGRTSGFLPHEEQLPREHYRQGDRIRAYITDVRDGQRGPQIVLSRTHPQLVTRLFEMEVPEIFDAIVEIKAVARDPGYRSKIAVRSTDAHIDPVGACVGVRGARVQGVVTELQGERIDIIEWSSDPAVFVCNALAPAEVSKVIMDEEDKSIKVVVRDDQLSLAIGRRGQNVRLAGELTGWSIDIVTEQEESTKRVEEYEELASQFVAGLDVDEDVASALIQEGFSSIQEVAYVPLDELSGIDGFDEDIALELRGRARDYLLQEAIEIEEEERTETPPPDVVAEDDAVADPIDPRLFRLSGLPEDMVRPLAEHGILALDDLADLATDELLELTNGRLDQPQVESLILEARQMAGWFDTDHASSTSR